MSVYVIGDLQGCLGPLEQLLARIPFKRSRDQLWFVGDLVNRGPQSLEVLRAVKSLDAHAVCVLGNHDLHLLGLSEDLIVSRAGDTLQDIFDAPDCCELLTWLRHRPLLHHDSDHVLVHAGLLPQWSVEQAHRLAREVETVLRGVEYRAFLAQMYGNHPHQWNADWRGPDRWRVITNALTRLRICTAQGEMEFSFKGPLEETPPGYMPWFEVPGRRSKSGMICFGHWSALGLIQGPDYLALDTGCLWGRQLTAVRLDDRAVFQVDCPARTRNSGSTAHSSCRV